MIAADSYITGIDLDNAWQLLATYGILHENLLTHLLKKFHTDYPTMEHVVEEQVLDILLYFHLVTPINGRAWFAETGYPIYNTKKW